MVDVDVNICKGLIFQILSAEISKKAIEVGCLDCEDSATFLSELIKVAHDEAYEMAKKYYDKYGYYQASKVTARSYLKNHLLNCCISNPIEGEDLLEVGRNFVETYECVYDYIGFNTVAKEFKINKWDEEKYLEEVESGDELWYYLCENGFELCGDAGWNVFIDKAFMLKIEVENEFILNIMKYTSIDPSIEPLVLSYLERLVYTAYGVHFLAISKLSNEPLKILVLQTDHFIDTREEVYRRMLYMAILPVMKKYIEIKMKKRVDI